MSLVIAPTPSPGRRVATNAVSPKRGSWTATCGLASRSIGFTGVVCGLEPKCCHCHAPGRNRTYGLALRRRTLYPLSYRRGLDADSTGRREVDAPAARHDNARVARTYRLTRIDRVNNAFFRTLINLGISPGGASLVTVRGRRSGRPHTTPVNPIERDGQMWLVAPYGAVGWVRNLRAAGEVTLSRGRRSQRLRAVEVGPQEAAPVLRDYLKKIRVVRPYFDVKPDGPTEAFVAEAGRHPVFRLDPAETPG
jgi:deazaflavin-dependent oxidoreductase (nitroreductase family)